MLHAISWTTFVKWLGLITLLYYCSIGVLFYKEKLLGLLRPRKRLMLLALTLTGIAGARAQDGTQGITQANTMIRGYYDTAAQLMYAIGGILALVGAVEVYSKLQNSNHRGEALQAGAAWFAGCIFLVVVATVIKSFFGL